MGASASCEADGSLVVTLSRNPAPTGGAPLIVQDWDQLTFRVHRRAYREQGYFDAERSLIWDRTWLYLGHETELPNRNDFVVRTLGGRPLIFCRDAAGELHAFLNSCPHRGTVLCRESRGNARTFQCFYHAWTFRTNGDVAAIPDQTAYADEAFRGEHAAARGRAPGDPTRASSSSPSPPTSPRSRSIWVRPPTT